MTAEGMAKALSGRRGRTGRMTRCPAHDDREPKRLPETLLPKLPRMADFALWATACETEFWPRGTFCMAYCGNRDEAVESVIDADPIAAAVRSFMAMRTEWTGTASDLLGALAEHVGETQRKNKSWPDSARALAGRLRRAATFLRKVGIEVTFGREGRARTRTIRLTAGPENGGSRPSTRSALPVSNIAPLPSNGLPADAARTVASPADGCEADPLTSVRSEPLKTNGGTVADHADANRPLQSGLEKTGSNGWRARL